MSYYEESIFVPAPPEEVFNFVNDHTNLSSHMSQSSWMMGGGHMDSQVDEGRGQKIGSHIRLSGKAFGMSLFLDEVVMEYEPPYRKVWQTVGNLKLLVIGHYRMGLETIAKNTGSMFKVFIEYNLPTSLSTRWLGYLFAKIYAKWCVRQMLRDVYRHFSS